MTKTKSVIHLLLVEDDAVDRLAIRRALALHPEYEFIIHEAETGGAGLQLAHSEQPDCVLLDYHLPDLDGVEFLRALAREDGAIPLPVMMLTGSDNAAVAVEAMRCGARDYLVKDTARQYLTLLPTVIERVLREQDLRHEKRHAERALAESAEFNRQIVNNAQEGIIVFDLNHRYRLWNPFMKKFSGMSGCDVLGKHPYEVFPHLREHAIDDLIERALAGETVTAPDISFHVPETGKMGWSTTTFAPLYNAAGETTGALVTVHDITQRKHVEEELHYHHRRLEELVVNRTAQLEKQTAMLGSANTNLGRELDARRAVEAALARQKELAEVTLASIGDAVIATDAAGSITILNPAAEKLTNWNRSDAVGLSLSDVFPLLHETTREVIEAPARACTMERNVALPDGAVLVRRGDGEVAITGLASLICARDGDALGSVIVFRDATQERYAARQLAHQANHDALTGLVNRLEFEQRVARVLAQSQTDHSEHALLYLDLDQFKSVNDGSGHAAGDELLQQLSTRVQGCMRARDTLARLGGDEFGVLLEHCPLDQAALRAEQLRDAVRDFHFTWQGISYQIGASIGLVPLSAAFTSVDAALRAADTACYRAKELGRNRVQIFRADEAPDVEALHPSDWATRLTEALEQDRFQLYFQSTQPLQATPIARPYQEVLLRLLNADGSVVLPNAFLPAAVRLDFMRPIDRWVLRRTLAHCAANDAGDTAPIYAVNLSAASMNDAELPSFIRILLDEYRVPGRVLCLEVAESVLVANIDRAASMMRDIKALGCLFALDNYGTGVSSFTDLQRLPLDFIKLDGRFIGDPTRDRVRRAMTEAVNNIAHVMAIQTVAAGTEDNESIAVLKELGLDHVQGYAIMRPQSLGTLAGSQRVVN